LKQKLPDLKAGAAWPERIEIAAQAEEEAPARGKRAGKKSKRR
jgi:hypothetical protein